jgi:uncharacterized membrane protein YcaP (DUF421 family)
MARQPSLRGVVQTFGSRHAVRFLDRARPGGAGRTLAYAALVLLPRISGKRTRTLTKLNAFNLVVTVALGSTLATVLLSKSVALAEGVLALGLLIFLQYAIAWLSVRSPRFQAFIKAEPTLLVHRAAFSRGR